MAAIKHHDFVEIGYTGTIKDTQLVFDTTNSDIAKKNNIFDKEHEYTPIIICIGENQIVKGIDEFLFGKEAGNEYKIELSPENAFGKKDASLIQLIPTSKFTQQGINPMPGLQINIDGIIGTIKSVSGGRTLVDFNHPLSGREIIYNVKINRILTDDKEKLEGFLMTGFHLGKNDFKAAANEGKASIELKRKIPKELEKEFGDKIKEVIPSLREVVFTIIEEKKGK